MNRLQILATGNEQQRPLHRLTVGVVTSSLEGFDQEGRVRQIGPLVLAVAGAAVAVARLVVSFVLVPLKALDEPVGQEQLFFRVECLGDVAGRDGEHVFDQHAREAQATVVALHGARRCQDLNASVRRVRQPDLFQRCQSGFVNACNVGIGQRRVSPAGHTGADRARVLGDRGGAKRLSGGAAAGAAGRSVSHGIWAFIVRRSG